MDFEGDGLEQRGRAAVSRARETGPAPSPPAEGAGTAPAARALDRHHGSVICRRCGTFVAELTSKIEVNGAHAHAFINPAGLIFRVGCFAEAPGVCALGEASADWSWFAGFTWQAAICRGCNEHLGWCYASGVARFTALILDRVAEVGQRPG
jgi:hypothetical protein